MGCDDTVVFINASILISCGRHESTRFQALARKARQRQTVFRISPQVYAEVTGDPSLAEIYRCRWEVELLFRGLKTQYELDELDTSDEHVVRILLYAALLSLLVSRDLLDLVTEQADDELVFPAERWAVTLRSGAQLILHEPGEYLSYSPPLLLERLTEDAQKIHK